MAPTRTTPCRGVTRVPRHPVRFDFSTGLDGYSVACNNRQLTTAAFSSANAEMVFPGWIASATATTKTNRMNIKK